jgi:transposase-like protein
MGQTFDKNFKQEAVRLVQTSGKSQRQGASDLGVAMSTLSPGSYGDGDEGRTSVCGERKSAARR